MAEFLHIKPTEGPCEVHDIATDGLARKMITLMRERHGKGGLNACRECCERAMEDARRLRARKMN